MRATLKSLRDSLRPIYGRGETEAIIRIIFHHLKGWSAVDMIVHEGEPLSPFIKTEIEKIRQRLLKQEPIQYITGEARFHGLNLKVSPDVLIPRPETEELVDLIVDEADDRTDLRVLDIGTGSGCIAIALARSLRFPYIYALDVSQKALQVARKNTAEHKVNISFIEADIFSWQPSETFDIIVSNPPYID
ncbi:MAG: peptide chain release factor N(5)-glutamine methyltransferase, partial [Muribaculaceae bacterium]|nr:peptide chain release factor N(5)-glutamine methyltransferase [Muribaculaceae bacterium]